MPGASRGGQQTQMGGRGGGRSQRSETTTVEEVATADASMQMRGERSQMDSQGFDRPPRRGDAPEEVELTEVQVEIVSGILTDYDATNLTEEDIAAIQAAFQSAIEAGELLPNRTLAEAVEEYGFDPFVLFPQEGRRSPPEEIELTEEQIETVSGILSAYDAENLTEEEIAAIQEAFQSAIEAGELLPNRTLAETVEGLGFDPFVLFPQAGRQGAQTDSSLSEIDSYLSGDESVDDSEEFNVEVNFLGEWSSELAESVTKAADYLSDLIQNDISLDGSADLTIDIALLNIDGENGVLGSSTVTDTWGDSYTPSESLIEFDVADANSYYEQGLWDDIVLHEMIHSLGFGTVWQNEGIVEVTTDESGEAVAEYSGESASAQEPTDADSPVVETDGGTGTAYGHWDEETYDNELMTGTIDENNYISDMTLGALEDLGYEIDYTIDVSNYLGIDSEASLTAATSVVASAESSDTVTAAVSDGEMLVVADILDLGEGNLIFPQDTQVEQSVRSSSTPLTQQVSAAREFGPMQFSVDDLVGPPLALFE